MKLMPGYNYIDFAKYAFMSNKRYGSYVYETWEFDYGTRTVFRCEHCEEHYDIKDLEIMNQAVHCKCGEIVKIADFAPYHHSRLGRYTSNKEISILQHNLNNGKLN